MSSEIIILIIGAVLILVSVVDSIKMGKSPLNLIDLKVKIPMAIFGILLIFYGAYTYGGANLPGQIEKPIIESKSQVIYPIESIQVLSPVENDSVGCRILTSGVYPESHDKDIWVLLKPTDNRYYPQSDHTNTSYKRKGEWQVITRFGGDKGEKYEIIVYEADSAASRFFSATIQQWKDMESYPGLELFEIPEGASEVTRLTVFLKENCRGVY